MTTCGWSPTASGSAISVTAISTGPSAAAAGNAAVTSTLKSCRISVMVAFRAQLAAQQLAGGIARQRRHELPLGRHLEARQRGARESPQFLAGRRGSRIGRHHEGLDGLAE